MNYPLKLITVLLTSSILFSCGGDEEEMEVDMGISSGDLSRGQATLNVSGDETFEFENATVVGSTAPVEVEGKEYTFLSIVMGESGNSQQLVSIGFFIPEGQGTLPQNGNIPITFQLAAEDNTYAAVSIVGASDIYDSNTASTGILTISNSTEGSNSFEATFEIENISSFSDTSVDLEGAFKY